MNDNKTAHVSIEYDKKIKLTMPNYCEFHVETIKLVNIVNNSPEKWLDTGCGTGAFSIPASKKFKETKFYLADPSDKMLNILKGKLQNENITNIEEIKTVGTQDLNYPDEIFDTITAIQSHHYFSLDERKTATENCFRMLKSDGVYITFENIKPLTNSGVEIGLNRWADFQLSNGRTDEEVDMHNDRFGKEFFPITIIDHINLLKEVGFKTFEILWASYMQAGFYAIKK